MRLSRIDGQQSPAVKSIDPAWGRHSGPLEGAELTVAVFRTGCRTAARMGAVRIADLASILSESCAQSEKAFEGPQRSGESYGRRCEACLRFLVRLVGKL